MHIRTICHDKFTWSDSRMSSPSRHCLGLKNLSSSSLGHSYNSIIPRYGSRPYAQQPGCSPDRRPHLRDRGHMFRNIHTTPVYNLINPNNKLSSAGQEEKRGADDLVFAPSELRRTLHNLYSYDEHDHTEELLSESSKPGNHRQMLYCQSLVPCLVNWISPLLSLSRRYGS
jgi:hypothetical protein